jgi:putative sigma-54 modulation protein
MRVDVSFRNLATSEPLRDYASEKVARLRRVLVKPIDAQVVLSRDGFRNIAEARVRDKGSTFTGSESSEDDMYAAIDLMADKLSRQVRRRKDKIREHRADPTAGVVGRLEAEVSRTRAADLDAELDALDE